jgi:hypothetical protein
MSAPLAGQSYKQSAPVVPRIIFVFLDQKYFGSKIQNLSTIIKQKLLAFL